MGKLKITLMLLIIKCITSCSNNSDQHKNIASSKTDTSTSEYTELSKCRDTFSSLVYQPKYISGEGPCDSGYTNRLIPLADCVTLIGVVKSPYIPDKDRDGDFTFELKLNDGYEEILNNANPNGKYALFRELVCPVESKQEIHCEIIWAVKPEEKSIADAFLKSNWKKLKDWKNPILLPKEFDSVEITGRFVIDLDYRKKEGCFRPTYEIHPITKLIILKRK
jgi:hypothetical protein